jgi:hypothetical protein
MANRTLVICLGTSLWVLAILLDVAAWAEHLV